MTQPEKHSAGLGLFPAPEQKRSDCWLGGMCPRLCSTAHAVHKGGMGGVHDTIYAGVQGTEGADEEGRGRSLGEPRKSWLMRKQQERAALREGLAEWQANPYFCAGRVTVPALMDTFACQCFFNRCAPHTRTQLWQFVHLPSMGCSPFSFLQIEYPPVEIAFMKPALCGIFAQQQVATKDIPVGS